MDCEYHPKIIGKKGLVVNKIRQDHNVQISFPRRDDENKNLIKVVGYEDKAKAAQEDILKIVNGLVRLSISCSLCCWCACCFFLSGF